jgi:hypothetical protein
MISTLDTHQAVKNLAAAGFTDAQAEAVTTALRNAVDIDLSNLGTKADLAVLRAEIDDLRREFETLRGEFGVLRGELGVLRGEIDAKVERAKTELIKWVVGMGFAQVAILVALLRLIPGIHP